MLAALGWLAGMAVAAAAAAFATAEIGGAMLEVIDSGSEYGRAVRDTDTIDNPSGDAAYQRIQEAHRNGHQRQAVAIHNATRSVVKEVLIGRFDEQLKPSIGRLRGEDSPVGFGEVDLAADIWEATHPGEDTASGAAPGAATGSPSGGTQGGGTQPDPDAIVFRGQVDDAAMTSTLNGLIMTENEVVLRAPKAGGHLEGTLVMQWDDFAVGEFMVALAEGIAGGLFGDSTPSERTEQEALLATCTSDVRISGEFEGDFDPGISKLLGTATFTTDFLYNMRCRGPLPDDLKQKLATTVSSTTTTWEAVYDGQGTVSGSMAARATTANKPLPFRLVAQ